LKCTSPRNNYFTLRNMSALTSKHDNSIKNTFKYDDELFSSLKKVYDDMLYHVLDAITKPGRYVSIRVNTLKTNVYDVLYSLKMSGFKPVQHTLFKEAILLPILGPYKVQDEGKTVIADKRASESVYQGANLYGPGVLDADNDIKVGGEVVVKSPNGIIVGRGIARMTGKEMKLKPKGIAVEVVESVYRAPKIRELKEYTQGLIYEQSIPSITVGREVDPQPGEVIVDMCAAPGGKTTHIIELSKGKAKVIAFDHSETRIERMKREVSRLGLNGLVHIVKADSRYIHIDYPNIIADKVVLDPPCSSIGVRPKLYDSKTYKDIVSLQKYQFQFMKVANLILRKGGILIYSTCTLTLEENENLVLKAVSELNFELEELKYYVIASKPKDPTLNCGAVRFEPHIQDYPGYFIAKLRKV